MSNPSNRTSMRGQLTLRGVVIGVLGCVIITASSAYTALKMGALPWPIIFAAVISLFFLKLRKSLSFAEIRFCKQLVGESNPCFRRERATS